MVSDVELENIPHQRDVEVDFGRDPVVQVKNVGARGDACEFVQLSAL